MTRSLILSGTILSCLAAVVMALSAPAARAQESEEKLKWKTGPGTGKLGSMAEIKLPAGYRFLEQKDTIALLELMGNITDGDELGLLTPDTDDKLAWFIVFEFDDCGYVKDEEKKDLDADALLKSMKESDGPANEARKQRGLTPLKTVGWDMPPNYDDKTHNLQWALLLDSEGSKVINHNTRLLGRHGVMEAVLVGDPEEMAAGRKELQPLLAGFSFTSGNTYAEFRSGDKVAEYGLAALITGGAAAVALKTGLLQKAWKFLIVIGVAVIAGIKKLFGRRQSA